MRRLALIALAAGLGACGGGDDSTPTEIREPVEPGAVRYQLEWDDTDLEIAADGTWSTVNDLGYRVTVRTGYWTSYQISLVPCWLIEGTARTPTPRFDLGRILWSLVGGVAHAGHDDEPDPSLFDVPHVEALVERAPLTLGTIESVPTETYCKVHYLVGRSNDDTVNVPEGIDYERISAHIEGTWQLDDGEPVPFAIHTDFNVGKNLGLFAPGQYEVDGADLRLDPSEAGVEVTVYRRLAALFGDVDFAALDDDDLTRAVMLNVTDTMWAEIRVGDAITAAR